MARESSSEELKAMARRLLALTKAEKYVALRVTKTRKGMKVRLVVDNVKSEKWVFSDP